MLLEQEDPAWALPGDLRARDPFGARDCGWVEQMRPFIRQFSKPGERVLDPFCGFASTLLAAHLESRAGIGYDIEGGRIELARERLRRHAATEQQLHVGEFHGDEVGEIDLCLTNIPYFGCDWQGERPDQLYASPHYRDYLQHLAMLFRDIARHLRPGRHCIVMAQNLELAGQWLPQAWDVARVLGEYLQPCGERILLYPKTPQVLEPFASQSDRSHEYALIFRKAPQPQDLDGGLDLLRELQRQGVAFRVFGGFGRWLQDGKTQPNDIDLLLPADEANLNALLAALQDQGFQLSSWREPVQLPVRLADYSGRYYFRAERYDRQGRQLRLDLTWELDADQQISLGGGSACGLALA